MDCVRMWLLRVVCACCVATGAVMPNLVQGQEDLIDLKLTSTYKIAGLTVLGAEYTDVQAIKLFSSLQVGQEVEIPGDDIRRAVTGLWAQDLFSDIQIEVAEVRDRDVYLVIRVQELPRLTRYSIAGVNRSEQETVKGKIDLLTGRILDDNVLAVATKRIRDHYVDKGFLDVDIAMEQQSDTLFANGAKLRIHIDKGEKVKVDEIVFHGVEAFDEEVLARKMKETKARKWWRFYKPSKFLENSFQSDLQGVVNHYHGQGYRNARILGDSLSRNDEGQVKLDVYVEEGNPFYFGDITFTGNTKYRTTQLDSLLDIQRGEVFSLERLETRVFMDPKGLDLSSLYQDDGYLTFQARPIEKRVLGDTIDIEVRMMEGQQFRIGRVIVQGNSKTNDHVVFREIRTRPGDLFSRTDIIRTQRELSQLGYFNPEAFGVNPIQHPEDGTVDIEYTVEEKPSDQIELSGGWGGGRVVGTLGISFTNFAASKMFKKGTWRPIPTGDGQRVSLRAQSNGLFFQSYNFSFTEPWLGGKKPNSLSVSVWRSIQSNGQPKMIEDQINEARTSLEITGAQIGLGPALEEARRLVRVPIFAVLPALQPERLRVVLQLFQRPREQPGPHRSVGPEFCERPHLPDVGIQRGGQRQGNAAVQRLPAFGLLRERRRIARGRPNPLPLGGIPQVEGQGGMVHPAHPIGGREPQDLGLAHRCGCGLDWPIQPPGGLEPLRAVLPRRGVLERLRPRRPGNLEPARVRRPQFDRPGPKHRRPGGGQVQC